MEGEHQRALKGRSNVRCRERPKAVGACPLSVTDRSLEVGEGGRGEKEREREIREGSERKEGGEKLRLDRMLERKLGSFKLDCESL